MHGKENVIAPILQQGLGVTCFTPGNLDTDKFGTFTGEIERTMDAIDAARQKCLQAMQLYNYDLCVASEGSFGPHPSMFFIPANEELILFMDARNGIEIVARELSTATNFNSRELTTLNQLNKFASEVGFPSHALILRQPGENRSEIKKGIVEPALLEKYFLQLVEKYGAVHAETDMRAMYNPSRMLVIAAATKKLLHRIKSTCPQCGTPGFGITEAKKGLPCSLCSLPTQSTLYYICQCNQCHYNKMEERPDNKKIEDPMYCDFCNP
ncbi:MAG TPA: DUF6671 family protein [Chitinophagales bacterium]|nr:DUF6671 family protein [Chitinophagales bacterium]